MHNADIRSLLRLRTWHTRPECKRLEFTVGKGTDKRECGIRILVSYVKKERINYSIFYKSEKKIEKWRQTPQTALV